VGNHIYYARYLDILEEARGEFFRALGHPLLALQGADVIFPVTEVALKYLAPARYDDLLRIEITVRNITRVRLTLGSKIWRDATLLVEGHTTHVCTSCDEKPKRMPIELAEKLQQYLEPNSTDVG